MSLRVKISCSLSELPVLLPMSVTCIANILPGIDCWTRKSGKVRYLLSWGGWRVLID